MVELYRNLAGRNRRRWPSLPCLVAVAVAMAVMAAAVGTAGIVSAAAVPEGVHGAAGSEPIPTQNGPAVASFAGWLDDLVDSVEGVLVGIAHVPWLLASTCLSVDVDWADCELAYDFAGAALVSANDRFPDSLHNGKGDAFRHCTWAAWTTIGVDGRPSARLITELYELNFSPGIEKEMDRFNNNFGHTIGEVSMNLFGSAATAKHNGLDLFDIAESVCHSFTCDGTLSTIYYYPDETDVCA